MTSRECTQFMLKKGSRLAGPYTAPGPCHLRSTEATQPPHCHSANPRRTWVRCTGPDGGQAGALHGDRPRHLRLAAEGGKLQPETAGVPEGKRIGTVLNDPRRYEPPADRQV